MDAFFDGKYFKEVFFPDSQITTEKRRGALNPTRFLCKFRGFSVKVLSIRKHRLHRGCEYQPEGQ